MYTANNAVPLRTRDKLGTLAPGQLADFIIVDRDVLVCPLDDWLDTHVTATYVADEQVLP